MHRALCCITQQGRFCRDFESPYPPYPDGIEVQSDIGQYQCPANADPCSGAQLALELACAVAFVLSPYAALVVIVTAVLYNVHRNTFVMGLRWHFSGVPIAFGCAHGPVPCLLMPGAQADRGVGFLLPRPCVVLVLALYNANGDAFAVCLRYNFPTF